MRLRMIHIDISLLFTCIKVATEAITLWWTQVILSTSGLESALPSLMGAVVLLVTITSGPSLLAAASAAAFAALAAALALARTAFIARALSINTAALPESIET